MAENDNESALTITYESNPTEKNIDYAFQRLLFPVIAGTGFEPYKESRQEFTQILNTIMNWVVIYANSKDLTQIKWDEFIEIRQQLFDLDSKYLPAAGYYAEDAYEWALQFQVLLEKKIKEKDGKNGL